VIIQENWPEVPQLLRPTDTELTVMLSGLPLYNPSDFSYQQQVGIALGSEDNDRDQIASRMGISVGGVDKHLKLASQTIKRDLPEREGELGKALAKAGLPLQGLVYIGHDNGITPVGKPLERADLEPQEVITLKAFALGYSNIVAAGLARISVRTFSKRMPDLREKMGAKHPSGIVSNGYRMNLFAARREAKPIRLPDHRPAGTWGDPKP